MPWDLWSWMIRLRTTGPNAEPIVSINMRELPRANGADGVEGPGSAFPQFLASFVARCQSPLEQKERKLLWAFAWASGSRACDELPEAYRCPNRCGWNSSTQNSVVAVVAFVALLELDSRVVPG